MFICRHAGIGGNHSISHHSQRLNEKETTQVSNVYLLKDIKKCCLPCFVCRVTIQVTMKEERDNMGRTELAQAVTSQDDNDVSRLLEKGKSYI